MAFDFIFYGFLVIWVLRVARVLYRRVKELGPRFAIFGVPVKMTLGEIDLGTLGRKVMQLRVRSLETTVPGSYVVGVDVVNRTFASYRVLDFRLTAEQARLLQALLSRAIAESHE